MDWREKYADKLKSVDEAAALIESGDSIYTGMVNSVPLTFSRALHARREELSNVDIYYHLGPFDWTANGGRDAFRIHTSFTSPVDRGTINSGQGEYIPIGNFDREHFQRFHPHIDTGVVVMSPPDENGYMSFGQGLWLSKTMRGISDRWFAEVDERAIRTHGDNFMHISEVDVLFEHVTRDDLELPIRPRDPEVEDSAAVICTLIAEELVNDGDCLQIGLGDVSAALPVFLGNRRELGVQTELFGGGIVDLIDQGIVTGSQKTVGKGKAVGSGFAQVPDAELAKAHMHPKVELWDFCDTDDLRLLIQNDNYKTINNALQIDLTGQVTAETFGSTTFSGPGGQTVFAIAGSYSKGGASIIVTPSSSMVDGERKSRILPTLPQGAMTTVPRTFVDYVVTEQGIATLYGKTVRQRVDELVSVAHPDFKVDLQKQAASIHSL